MKSYKLCVLPFLIICILLFSEINVNATLVCAIEKFTPLSFALHQNDLSEVKKLIEKGEDLNEMNCDCRPIHIAAYRGKNIKMMELLIAHGADVNGICPGWGSALLAASMHGNIEAAEFLIKHGALIKYAIQDVDHTALHYSVYGKNLSGSKEIGELLIKHGADVNALNWRGNTPLHRAAKDNNLWAIKMLVENNASLTLKNREGKTPYELAVEAGNKNAAEFLKRAENGDPDASKYLK